MKGRVALIGGISGQDGAFLAKALIGKGYAVHGLSRKSSSSGFENLRKLGIADQVEVYQVDSSHYERVCNFIEIIRPDEVYNLGGQSSVGQSFQFPLETLNSITTSTLNFLEAIRASGLTIRFYNASSSECFGDVQVGTRADELTAFRPLSPYAVAKCSAHWLVQNYREAYGLYACSGILFNHESALRSAAFVTRKVIDGAAQIADGSKHSITLGNLSIHRDWGYAPEYVDGMWRMLQQKEPKDYVLATGLSHSLEEFVRMVFENYGMDWREYVDIDDSIQRPLDIGFNCGDPSRAAADLGWQAKTSFSQLVETLISTIENPERLLDS